MSDDAPALPTGDVRADLLVAGVAAAATVALTVALRFGVGRSAPPLPRLSPLAVYLLYLFLGKGETGSAVEDPRLWAGLSAVVAAATFGYYAV
ncbi:MAG: hypothetical protein ABEJ61_01730 [Haloferacaceae archaeon]